MKSKPRERFNKIKEYIIDNPQNINIVAKALKFELELIAKGDALLFANSYLDLAYVIEFVDLSSVDKDILIKFYEIFTKDLKDQEHGGELSKPSITKKINNIKLIIAGLQNQIPSKKSSISFAELEQEKQKRLALQRKAEEKEQKLLEEARKRKALEQRIAELEKKNKELSKAKKKETTKPKGGSGSGFFISKLGHIITNHHVVNQCSKITVGDSIDKQVPAQLLETDKRNDLALLRTTTLKLASAETKTLIQKLSIHIVPLATGGLMRGNDIELGEDVLVAGFPYGDIFSKNIKVTKGIVSSTTGVGDDSGQFQLDAAVQPGNSGGPIYDKYGNIVGVVVAQLNKFKMAKTIGSLPENVNFGIKASTVKQFLNTSGLPTKWSSSQMV